MLSCYRVLDLTDERGFFCGRVSWLLIFLSFPREKRKGVWPFGNYRNLGVFPEGR